MISGALLVGGNDGVRQWGWDDIPYPIYYGKKIYIYIWVWVKIRYPNNWMVNTKLD